MLNKNQVLFWTERTCTINFNESIPQKIRKKISIKKASRFDDVERELNSNPSVLLLVVVNDFDIEELSQAQRLAKSYPCVPLLMLSRSQFSRSLSNFSHNLVRSTISNCLARFSSSTESAQCVLADEIKGDRVTQAFGKKSDKAGCVGCNSSDSLTSRQKQVLELIVNGKSNKQIARELLVSEGTVKVHCMAIFREIGVNNRTQAALQANDFLRQA